MADVDINKFRASVVRDGSKPASPGFIVSEGQDPVNPPGTNNYVPYSGATANVELGEFGVEAGFITLDTTPTNTPTDQGTIFWDADDETVDIVLNGYTMKIGEDLFYPVKNQTGSTIAKGVAVRFNGTLGASGRLLIAPFIANGSVVSSRFMGVTAEEILNGEDGKVLYFGRVRGINTSAFSEGDILYASTTVAGGYQTAIPVAPNNIVQVAAVISSHANNGTIFVRPTLGSNINKDEGVKIVSVADKNLLQYQSGTSLWENKTLAQVIGSDYVPSTRTITINGTSQDLSANRTYNVGTVTSVGLSSATSGVTIGSTPITTSGTITLAIATASGSQNGLLSSTDWTTFNSKVSSQWITSGSDIYYSAGKVAIGTSIPSTTFGGLDISSGGIGLILGADFNANTRTNLTTKSFRVGGYHYTNSQSPFSILTGASTSTSNEISIGGGTASMNAATNITFITASNNTTITGTERMTITSNGNVGIGLNNPSSLLHIFGAGSGNSLTYTKYTCGDGGDIRVGKESGINNDAIFGTWSNNSVVFYSNSLPRLTIADSGAANFLNNVNQKFNDGGFNFYKSDGTTLKAFIGNLNGTTTDEGYLGLYKTNVQKVAIRASGTSYLDGGNVLIGTQTDNGARLQVSGTATVSGNGLFGGATAFAGLAGGIAVNGSTNSGINFRIADTLRGYVYVAGSGAMVLESTSGSVIVSPNGNPALTLAASTGAATFSSSVTTDSLFRSNQGILQLFAAGGFRGGLYTYNQWAGTGTDYSPTVASESDIFFATAGSITKKMTITSSGNVLIGTTTDNSHKLRVNGDLWVDGVYKVPASSYFICGSAGYRFNNNTDAFNNFVALNDGNATLRGTLTQNASDERLKNNIEIIPNAIDKIKQLRGVTFKWNQELYETSRTFDIGVIAQEVEQVLPNAVCLAPFDTNFDDNTSKSGQNYLTVYYEKLIPLLIEGIKELKQEIDTLKN